MNRPATDTSHNAGIAYAVLAFGSWGIIPVFWKGFGDVPAVEIIAHRLVWSLVFITLLVTARRELSECVRTIRAPRLLGVLFTTAALLSVNWALFVHAVNTKHIVEASLGYFINPLFNVLLGFVFLCERLTRLQLLAVALATAGVVIYGWHLAHVPWIALGLACTFGLYGLLRKIAPVAPLPGLLVETALMTPFALGWLGLVAAKGQSHFVDSPALTILFLCSGIITAFPLMWFISAAKLLPLSTMGFFQYLAPSLQLLVGLAIYHEPFTARHALSFGLIWTAIGVFLGSSLARREARSPSGEPAKESQPG